jgi:hypothetical protein
MTPLGADAAWTTGANRRKNMAMRWLIPVSSVLILAAACSQGGDPGTLPIPKDATIKDIMDSHVDPAGDFLFESVQHIADDKGTRLKAPSTTKEWAEVRHQFVILTQAPEYLFMKGRKAGRPSDKVQFPDIESSPAEIDALIAANHDDFVKRAKRLEAAAEVGIKAVDAKDVGALEKALLGIDRACESCHLHYYYPKDERAKQAAREEGLSLE